MAAAKLSKQMVVFSLFEPDAQSVLLAGDFTNWKDKPVKLKKQKSGVWTGTVPLAPGAYEYRYLVDGQWRDDPECQDRRWNSFGSQNCVRVIA